MDELHATPAPLETKRYRFEGAPSELSRRLRIESEQAERFRLALAQWKRRGARVFLSFLLLGIAAGTGLVPNMWSFWALVGMLAAGLFCGFMILVYRDRGVSSRKLHGAIAVLDAATASGIATVLLRLDLTAQDASPALEDGRWVKRVAQTWLKLEFSRGAAAWRLAARKRVIQPVSVGSFPAVVPDGPDEGSERVYLEVRPFAGPLKSAARGVRRMSLRDGRLRLVADHASCADVLAWAVH